MRSFIFIISILLCLTCSLAQEFQWGNYIIQQYTPDDYGAGIQNWAVEQNSNGILYFGNREGLVEFDGEKWRKIEVSNKTVVRSLALDKNDRLYIGASNEFGYLDTDSLGCSVYKSLKELLPDSLQEFKDVWNIMILNEKVYFQTRGGFYVYDNDSIEVIKPKAGIIQRAYEAHGEIYLFIVDNNGDKDGLYILDRSTNSLIYTDYRKDNRLSGVIELDDGNVLFVTNRINFLHYDVQSQTLSDHSEAYRELDSIVDNELPYAISKLSNGEWCIGTLKNGIYFFNPNTKEVRHVGPENGLLGLTVYKVFEDQLGNIWAAGEEGINYIQKSEPLRNLNALHGVEGTPLSSMLFQDRLYLGTSIGAFEVSKSGLAKKLLPMQDQTWQIFSHNEDLYTVITSGIVSINGEKHEGVFFSEPWMVAPFPNDDQFVMGNYDNGISILETTGNGITLKHKVEGFDKNSRKVAVDFQNIVWVSDRGLGVWKLELNEERDSVSNMEFFGEDNGLPSDGQNYVHSYRLDNKPVALIGSREGFYCYSYSAQKLEPLKDLNKLLLSPGNIANGFDFDESGNICFVNNEKFMVIENSWSEPVIDSVSLMLLEGLALDEINSIGDGQFAIATEKGTYIYDVDRSVLKKPETNFQSQIRTVRNNGKLHFGGNSTAELGVPSFEFSNNNFVFEYASNFSVEPERTNYFVKLEGFEESWSSATKEVFKEYTNLSEGSYTFKVKAINYLGQESETGIYVFEVLPPWYRTTLAYAGFSLLGILMFVGAVRIYSRKLQKDNERLEEIVKERTVEVENQKTEIAAQAEELKFANEELLKLGNYRESMTGMIAHDMKTPLSVIMNSNDELATKQMAGQMLHLINNMLDVHRFESTEVNLKLEEVSFNDLIKASEKQVRFLLDEKDLSLKKSYKGDFSVSIDQSIMLRVMVNLFTNAIKFSPFNGVVMLNAKVAEELLEVSVNNKGRIIPDDKIESIFMSFGQLEAKDSGGIGSTGLGLTFVKLALDAHDTDISVSSNESEGTTFGFKLNLVSKRSSEEKIKSKSSFDPAVINEFIKPNVEQLQELQVHQIGELDRVLNELKGKDKNVDEWIEQVLNAAYAGNLGKYEELMKLVVPAN